MEKDRNRHWNKKSAQVRAKMGADPLADKFGYGKVGVIGAIARKGNVVARVIGSQDAPTLAGFVQKVVSDQVSLAATDENPAYNYVRAEMPHETVHHGRVRAGRRAHLQLGGLIHRITSVMPAKKPTIKPMAKPDRRATIMVRPLDRERRDRLALRPRHYQRARPRRGNLRWLSFRLLGALAGFNRRFRQKIPTGRLTLPGYSDCEARPLGAAFLFQ